MHRAYTETWYGAEQQDGTDLYLMAANMKSYLADIHEYFATLTDLMRISSFSHALAKGR